MLRAKRKQQEPRQQTTHLPKKLKKTNKDGNDDQKQTAENSSKNDPVEIDSAERVQDIWSKTSFSHVKRHKEVLTRSKKYLKNKQRKLKTLRPS